MTLQQLKYVVTVARTGSMSEASKELFISQPGLTTSIRELETEMGIKIFTRTNKGVVTSNEGERFLGYARQVLEQASLLEGVYKSGTKIKRSSSAFQPSTTRLQSMHLLILSDGLQARSTIFHFVKPKPTKLLTMLQR